MAGRSFCRAMRSTWSGPKVPMPRSPTRSSLRSSCLSFVDELASAQRQQCAAGYGLQGGSAESGPGQRTTRRRRPAEEAPPAPPPQPAAPTAKVTAVADFDKPPKPPPIVLQAADRMTRIPTSSGSPPGSHHTSDDRADTLRIQTPVTATSARPISPLSCWVCPAIMSRRCLQAACRFSAPRPKSRQRPIRHFLSSSRCGRWSAPARTTSSTRPIPIACRRARLNVCIDVHVTFPDAGITAKTATITNLPAGFAINNGTQSGSNWIVTLDPSDPNHLQIELRYVLPTSATQPDANGFPGQFQSQHPVRHRRFERCHASVFRKPDFRHSRHYQRRPMSTLHRRTASRRSTG